MTSASIMEVQKTGFAPQTNVSKAQPVNATAQFSDAMEFASAGQQDSESVQSPEAKAPAEKNPVQNTGHKEIREVEQTDAKAEVSEEEVSEEMSAKEEELVEEIAEKFGVSEEEVRKALEMLGLSITDLMSQGNMAMLAAQLTGMQPVDVLTDENLFAQVTELTAVVQDELQAVADELGISLEQLQAAVEEAVVSHESKQVAFAEVMTAETDLPADETAQVEVVTAETEVSGGAERKVLSQETPEEETVIGEKDVVVAKTTTETEDSQMAGGEEKGNHDGATLMQAGQNTAVVKNDINTAVQADPLFESNLDIEQTRELINQIADHVRLHRSEAISSMEIQLHPVELGTVNLQVVAKDGTVSARLAVQDEAVRAAMESQIVQLRETLQEQGLKIDAVEVTVATHEFEQNLDQHGREAEENAAKEKKNGRRILDLNEIGQDDLDGEEMSDADRLQVEMMRMGGNRLNLRV